MQPVRVKMSRFLFSFPPIPTEALGVVTYLGHVVIISSVGVPLKRSFWSFVLCTLVSKSNHFIIENYDFKKAKISEDYG